MSDEDEILCGDVVHEARYKRGGEGVCAEANRLMVRVVEQSVAEGVRGYSCDWNEYRMVVGNLETSWW